MSEDTGNTILNIEILGILKDLKKEFREHRIDVSDVKTKIAEIDRKIENIIRDAFVDGDLKAHAAWHKRNRGIMGFFNRVFRR